MSAIPENPLLNQNLTDFYHSFRNGTLSSEKVTQQYLKRINALDPELGAYEYVAVEQAMQTARAMDQLVATGVDLGPLMGVPISIKDVFNIQGLPAPTVGSKVDLSTVFDIKTEGSFIKALRAAGCVILGQTKTVEFCLGITGVSAPRGTPKNPHDPDIHRIPGGSSSGSAVAVAAGLCAFAIGTDTGGSVRVPAAFNGIFSLKISSGIWPTDGVFPLDPKLDSIGLLTRTAEDAQTAYHAINSSLYGYTYQSNKPVIKINRLIFGKPENYFFDGLSETVQTAIEQALNKLTKVGVTVDDCHLPGAEKRERYFPVSLPVELLAFLGKDFFQKNKDIIDPIIATRIESALQSQTLDFISLEKERQEAIVAAVDSFQGYDAWITPATADVAPPLTEFEDSELAMKHALGMTRNSQPANYLDLCGVSMPIESSRLPVGLQLMAPAGHESRLLAIAAACEKIVK